MFKLFARTLVTFTICCRVYMLLTNPLSITEFNQAVKHEHQRKFWQFLPHQVEQYVRLAIQNPDYLRYYIAFFKGQALLFLLFQNQIFIVNTIIGQTIYILVCQNPLIFNDDLNMVMCLKNLALLGSIFIVGYSGTKQSLKQKND